MLLTFIGLAPRSTEADQKFLAHSDNTWKSSQQTDWKCRSSQQGDWKSRSSQKGDWNSGTGQTGFSATQIFDRERTGYAGQTGFV